MISGIGQGENENHDTMHRFALVAFFGAGFFAVAMIYSPLAVVTANLFLAAYSRLFPKIFSRL